MRDYHSDEIGNVAILGHSGSGKTSVIEAMAYRSGKVSQIGTIKQGNTISDFDEEEKKRQSSMSLSVIPLEWQNCKINLLDTPGAYDFQGEVQAALAVSESAVIVVPATKGLTTGTKQAMYRAHDKAKIIYINNIDYPNNDYHEKLKELQEVYGRQVAPIQVPIMENNKMVGYVNVAKMEGRRFEGKETKPCPIPEGMDDLIQPVKDMIDEAVANTSDDLLDKYLAEEPFTKEEISLALREGVIKHSLIPVLCGTNTIGIQQLLNSIVAFFPAAGDTVNSFIITNKQSGEEDIAGYDEGRPTSIHVFKTIADPFAGHISIFKVVTGHVEAGMKLVNMRNGREEDFSKIYIMTGKKMEETGVLYAGDIGAVMKLDDTHTNDVLNVSGYQYVDEPIKFPQPYYGKALKPIGKVNEDKISAALNRFLEEDPTLRFETNAETAEQCLYGLGDIHLTTVVDRLKDKYNVEVKLSDITLCFRETIRNEVTHRTKYKKQTGGHGQYGDVEIKFEPTHDYDTPYVFAEEVFGGAVPKSYFPAVEKGLAEAVQHGVLAGYPVLGIKATLLDGSYHPVDSSEQAFKTATLMCFKSALPKANPILLEPYVTINAVCEESYLGDIMSYFNKHRSRVIGQEILDDGLMKITAEAPQAEVMNFAIDLKSMTQGSGYFTETFLDYEYMDKYLQERVIEARKDKVE